MTLPYTYRMLGLLLCSLTLCQCASQIAPDVKAGLRKVVVATNVGQKVTRQKVGITAFGNAEIASIETPELRQKVQQMLKSEISPRFSTVIFASEEPPQNPQNQLFGNYPDRKAWAMGVGSKYQADAVLLITGYWGYPYGMPSYMTAEGLGIWHAGKTAVVKNHASIELLDPKTGKRLCFAQRVYGGQQVKKLPEMDDFQAYSGADQTRLIQAAVEEFRLDLKAFLDGSGL